MEIIVRENAERRDLRVLDVGCGSGAIAIALSRNLLFPEVTAIDISREAADVARENARMMSCRKISSATAPMPGVLISS